MRVITSANPCPRWGSIRHSLLHSTKLGIWYLNMWLVCFVWDGCLRIFIVEWLEKGKQQSLKKVWASKIVDLNSRRHGYHRLVNIWPEGRLSYLNTLSKLTMTRLISRQLHLWAGYSAQPDCICFRKTAWKILHASYNINLANHAIYVVLKCGKKWQHQCFCIMFRVILNGTLCTLAKAHLLN